MPEVEDRSGTGFASCAFRYSGAVADLTAFTAGEGGENGGLPLVARYAVDCRQATGSGLTLSERPRPSD